MKTLKDYLNELVKIEGINTAVLVSRDGFVLDGAVSGTGIDIEALGAVLSTGIGTSEVMGTEMKVGELRQNMAEYSNGVILFNLVGDNTILAVVADLKAPLGNVRYQVKKHLAGIEEIL
jgi:uncharacterized protein